MSPRKPFPGVVTPDALKLAEKRAYARGYMRGRNSVWRRYFRVAEIAKAYRTMGAGGHVQPSCGTCARWLRGDGHNNSADCKWGSCAADFDYNAEARMWADTNPMSANAKIITSEDFGCVNWLPKAKP